MIAPHPAVGNAGGEFYLHHARALQALGHDVQLVVPRGRATDDQLRSADVPIHALDVPYRFDDRPWTALNRVFVGGLRPRYTRAVLADPIVRDWVRAADAVEYQWSEFATLARLVEPLRARSGPSWVVVHDEVVQRETRKAGAARGWRRAVLKVGARVALARERRAFRAVGRLLTISEKDAALCRAVAPDVQVQVVDPPVVPRTDAVSDARPGEPIVLFVGALARAENEAGILWFLREVWPIIAESRPSARLRIAGSDPSAVVRAQADDRIDVTGFVPDLAPLYRAASVVIVPLLSGAGVKFKTIAALAHGLPVVSTRIGAEGVFENEPDRFAAISDDPVVFGRAVCGALDAPWLPARRNDLAERVVTAYGIDNYPERLSPFLSAAAAERRAPRG